MAGIPILSRFRSRIGMTCVALFVLLIGLFFYWAQYRVQYLMKVIGEQPDRDQQEILEEHPVSTAIADAFGFNDDPIRNKDDYYRPHARLWRTQWVSRALIFLALALMACIALWPTRDESPPDSEDATDDAATS